MTSIPNTFSKRSMKINVKFPLYSNRKLEQYLPHDRHIHTREMSKCSGINEIDAKAIPSWILGKLCDNFVGTVWFCESEMSRVIKGRSSGYFRVGVGPFSQ